MYIVETKGVFISSPGDILYMTINSPLWVHMTINSPSKLTNVAEMYGLLSYSPELSIEIPF